MKEHKSKSIAVDKLQAEVAKLKKEGWAVDGYGFAPEGASHSLVRLSREKQYAAKKPVAKKAPAKKK